MYPQLYSKQDVDPYTKVRIILMNGIEMEAAFFSHQFHRNCNDNNLRRELAMNRRIEQQQRNISIGWNSLMKRNWKIRLAMNMAVDLTAWLAQNEPDP